MEAGGKKDAAFIADLFEVKVLENDPQLLCTDVFYFDGASNVQKAGEIFHMGKQMERIPISTWGSPYRNGSLFPNRDGSVTNPFPNRVCAHLGIEIKITIWECFPYGDHRLVWCKRRWITL